MSNKYLQGMKVAVFSLNAFEEFELTKPVKALRDVGVSVDIISIKLGSIQAFRTEEKSIKVRVDKILSEIRPQDYHALVLPGGAFNADTSRMMKPVQQFVKYFSDRQMPIACICHALWLLISTKIIKGRRVTCFPAIVDDVKNAGAIYIDDKVVVDKNIVSSRYPNDIPYFNREMLILFYKYWKFINKTK
jgi:protease I